MYIYSFNDALNTGFNRLFNYISGENEGNVTIDMTAPVLDYIMDDTKKEVYTISFYVPSKYQKPNYPPKPTNPKVFISTIGPIEVGVTAFDGFENPREDREQEKIIDNSLSSAGVSYDKNNWFFGGYDPPFRLTGRHNEVWVQVYNY